MIMAFGEIGKTQEGRNFKEKINPDFNSNLELLRRHSSEDELVVGKWNWSVGMRLGSKTWIPSDGI